MSGWLSKLLGTEAANPEQRWCRAPIEPFESIVDDGPPIGKRLFRPLVYSLEHRTLPRAVFTSHPELQQALLPTPTAGGAFTHMWSMSAVDCDGSGLWPAGLIQVEGKFWQYARILVESLVCVPTQRDGAAIWAIRTPRPETLGETHFIGISKLNDEPWAYPSSPPSCRYFTLEETFDPSVNAFCEWTREGTHVNFGTVPKQTSDGFTELVLQRLAAGA